ncbi:hypothetical protein [uncultured Acetobacteroides sp.]|nr:hypothetical protein [uncultured Acetobacteroides sp.]
MTIVDRLLVNIFNHFVVVYILFLLPRVSFVAIHLEALMGFW